ncbi:MAG TPA: hypothetical protein VNO18_09960, partial [Xanthobacteraceae bacterium]|nr:hypothetical protein [Xanthobacteraceae bacterium]
LKRPPAVARHQHRAVARSIAVVTPSAVGRQSIAGSSAAKDSPVKKDSTRRMPDRSAFAKPCDR